MNDSHHESLDERQQQARDAVRALAEPVADPDFRARLRAEFVAGSLSTSPSEAEVRTLAESRPAHGPNDVPTHRVRPWARALVPLALAASLVLMVTLLNRGPSWQLVKADAEWVEIDGERMPCDDLSPIQARLRPGCEIRVPNGGQLEIASEGTLYLQFNGGVEATLPPSPGRWYSREVSSQVGGRGTLRVVTAPAFQGATYRIQTPSAELQVTGTAFAVICGEDELCVCVLEGDVRATMADGSQESIPPGGRLTVHGGHRSTGNMLPTERDALSDLRSRTSPRS